MLLVSDPHKWMFNADDILRTAWFKKQNHLGFNMEDLEVSKMKLLWKKASAPYKPSTSDKKELI